MATLILVRHGRSTANTAGVLAGRSHGVLLDETGQRQVRDLGERLRPLPLSALISSPLERCRQTAEAIAALGTRPSMEIDDRLTECDYGSWQGKALVDLAHDPLWETVQSNPSAVVFPEGESLPAMQDRALDAVRDQHQAVESTHGPDAFWAVVSHGDVIKAVLADALATPLDDFQRIHVDPASVSVIHFGKRRPTVLGLNTRAGSLEWLVRPAGSGHGREDDAVPGGGSGPETAGPVGLG